MTKILTQMKDHTMEYHGHDGFHVLIMVYIYVSLDDYGLMDYGKMNKYPWLTMDSILKV